MLENRMTVIGFLRSVLLGMFNDDDGIGEVYSSDDPEKYRGVMISPSRIKDIPDDATHIIWYNK